MISTYEFLATWLRARFSDSDRGASLVEYALLVALIAVVCIVAIQLPRPGGQQQLRARTGSRHRRRLAPADILQQHEEGRASGPSLFASVGPAQQVPRSPPSVGAHAAEQDPVLVAVVQRAASCRVAARIVASGVGAGPEHQVDAVAVEDRPRPGRAVRRGRGRPR